MKKYFKSIHRIALQIWFLVDGFLDLWLLLLLSYL